MDVFLFLHFCVDMRVGDVSSCEELINVVAGHGPLSSGGVHRCNVQLETKKRLSVY